MLEVSAWDIIILAIVAFIVGGLMGFSSRRHDGYLYMSNDTIELKSNKPFDELYKYQYATFRIIHVNRDKNIDSNENNEKEDSCMTEEGRKKLSEEIDQKIEETKNLEFGSEQYKTATQSLYMMQKVAGEYDKGVRETEMVKKQHKLNIVEIGGGLLVSVAGLVLYDVWNKRGYQFETTGTVCSSTFRRMLSDTKVLKR